MITIKDHSDPKNRVMCEAANLQEALIMLNGSSGIIAGADFSGLDFTGLDLRKSNFCYCKFDGANIMGVSLVYSEIWGCTFKDAQLAGSNLYFCELTGDGVINAGAIEHHHGRGGLYVGFEGSTEPQVWHDRDFEPLSRCFADLPEFPTSSDVQACEIHMRLKLIEQTAKLRGWPLKGDVHAASN